MHPVGPLNPKVYWVRRVSIVGLAVAVLIGLVWFLASRTSRSSAGQEPTAAVAEASAAPTLTGVLAASSGPTRSAVPSPSAPPSGAAVSSGAVVPSGAAVSAAPPVSPAPAPDPAAATPAADPVPAPTAEPPPPPAPEPPPPSYDAQGKLICPQTAISVTAITAAPTFGTGSQPTLGMIVTNAGSPTCQLDVSGTLQTFTVYAADGTRVWSTADCFPGQGTEVRELTTGQALKYTVKWSGTSSAPGCTGDRAPLPAGDYGVVAQLGALTSQPTAFAITG